MLNFSDRLQFISAIVRHRNRISLYGCIRHDVEWKDVHRFRSVSDVKDETACFSSRTTGTCVLRDFQRSVAGARLRLYPMGMHMGHGSLTDSD